VEPSLLETEVLEAPSNACNSASVLDPPLLLLLLLLLESLDPSEAATLWWWCPPLPPAPFSALDISSRLTEPPPFWSSLLKTSSACATLVPPAPSAFSNSDFDIWPSPLASIFENRSFSESEGLADAEVVDEVEDWPCAASSALIVCGEICEKALVPEPALVLWLVAVAALLAKSNGLLAPWLKPVDGVDEDFDENSP
jgi:hypothetical protein